MSSVDLKPIHASAPNLTRFGAAAEIFHTGIKIIDLLAPLVKGGKAAMFGGAGVGKTVLIAALMAAELRVDPHQMETVLE